MLSGMLDPPHPSTLTRRHTIQWNLSIEDTIGTQLAVLYTVEPLYRGHHWDPAGCPVWRGVPYSDVDLYTAVFYSEYPYREVPLYARDRVWVLSITAAIVCN